MKNTTAFIGVLAGLCFGLLINKALSETIYIETDKYSVECVVVVPVVPEPEPEPQPEPKPEPEPDNGATVKLSWEHPTHRDDGSVLKPDEIRRYGIFYVVDGEYTWVGAAKYPANSYTLDVPTKRAQIAIVTVDTDERRSKAVIYDLDGNKVED